MFEVGNGLEEGESRLDDVEIGSEGPGHDLPGVGGRLPDEIGHVPQPAIVVEQDLTGPFVAPIDDCPMRRVGDSDCQVEETLQRSHVVAQRVDQVEVVHDDGGDPGQDMVA